MSVDLLDDSEIPTMEAKPGHDDEDLQLVDGENCIKNELSVNGENVCAIVQSPQSECDSRSFVVKARADSKLILQNMEEVLNSVKKKHRQKHRRKKEQKKLAMMAEAAHEMTEEVQLAATNTSSESKSKKMSKKKPLQEQQIPAQSSELNLNGKRKQYTRKRHTASISPSNSPMAIEKTMNSNCNESLEQAVTPKSSTITNKKIATNAFEVMMNARNKTIGSNTPGKEASPTEGNGTMVNNQRKLLLQSWAERKGSLKRKLDEEMRAAFVEDRLNKRAKRLKKLLTTTGSPSSSTASLPANSPEPQASNKQQEPTNSSKKYKSETRKKAMTRRSRRFSSTDSLELKNDKKPILDAETVEFLSKLSSPTKKRDSLLGYFPKIPSPNGSVATSTPDLIKPLEKLSKNLTETPKRRGRKPRASLNIEKVETEEEIIKLNGIEIDKGQPLPQTSCLRPKRACAEKNKYDYDLMEADESPKKKPDKTEEINSRDQRRSSTKRKKRCESTKPPPTDDIAEKDEIFIIDLDSTGGNTTSTELMMNAPKKLAPLFVRSLPKPSLDTNILKARQEFLRSGVPDKLKLEQDKQKQYEQNYEEAIELFPKISHRQQWTNDEIEFLTKIELNLRFQNSSDESVVLGLNEEEEQEEEESLHEIGMMNKSRNRKSKTIKFLGITNCVSRDFRQCNHNKSKSRSHSIITENDSSQLPIVKNKRLIIKEWKLNFDRFPTYKCYNQLRTKYHFFSALDSAQDTEQVTESFVVTRSTRRSLEATTHANRRDSCSEEDIKPPAMAPNGELLFTEKYKPMLFEQVLVNMMPVSQLRDFLANWANGNGGNGGNGNGSGAGAKGSQISLDESMDFFNDSNSSQQAICNSVVLLGPASSGKTNAVFTLANEMNFNVLEINAGMKRTGKKLIQELLEATQSHQIRNESTGGAAVKSKAQKNLLKMSLNSLKSRTNEGETASSQVTADLNSRKCLILIEDADIVFEQFDAGFTDAVYTLAASSKRPVIAIATNPNCQHLQRLMLQNMIKFTEPNALNVSKYLAVLSLMENCPVSLDDLISLFLFNRHDLRKTLHELQFFIQSGGDRKRQQAQVNGTVNVTINESKEVHENDTCEKSKTGKYFASPNKSNSNRRESQEENSQSQDEQLKRESKQQQQQQQEQPVVNEEDLYVHRTLFEFYTVDQNAQWRVPFPVNFRLFYFNLSDIFANSKKLNHSSYDQCKEREKKAENSRTAVVNHHQSTKRKTRSPKKLWLSNATATATVEVNAAAGKCRNSRSDESLDALSSFYNNVSIASLVATCATRHDQDRLKPYLSESISHDLLELAISVNLEAELCPYNLFEEQKKSIALYDYIATAMAMLPKRARYTDFEPVLRSICRSEQERATQERRSTRFYHYLRNSCVDICNWSQKPFDVACSTFQEDEIKVEQQEITCDE